MTNANGKRIPEHKRWKITGRGKGHSFLRLPHFLIESPEFEALSGAAVKLLVDIAKQFRGANNGDLSMGWQDMGKRGWNSQGTLHRAKEELLEAGFIVCTRHGGSHRCALYAITWEPMDACEGKGLEIGPSHKASHAWRKQNGHSDYGSEALPKLERSGAKEANRT